MIYSTIKILYNYGLTSTIVKELLNIAKDASISPKKNI